MKKEKEQVSLYKLVFTQNWEDPESDQQALRIKAGESVMAITSGGCNVLGFLLYDPAVIYSIDINPTQSYILELKMAAIRCLDFDDFLSFSGLRKSTKRLFFYQQMVPYLSKEAAQFWNSQQKLLGKGFIMNGRYERFISLAAVFVNMLQGKKRVRGLFEEKTKGEQARYFDKVWNTRRFRFLFTLLFNKQMLAKRGLVADYFHFDDGSRSFAESFYNRSKKVLRDIPVKGNYFLSLYLLGKYRNEDELPPYLQKTKYNIIKSRLDRIHSFTAGAQDWIDTMPDQSIDCFALSNICELMSEKETTHLFGAVARSSRKNGRVVFRNLMIPREVPEKLRDIIVKDEELSSNLFQTDRSFVYGKVAGYTIHK